MTEFTPDIDMSELDDLTGHATCTNVTPWGSLHPGKMYRTLCGKQVMYRGTAKERCLECELKFNTWPCPLCGKSDKEH
jgi:hypothetical protein